MLQKRENELRRRREHVEKLLKWHQRLDGEEQEVLKMERMIMFISTSDVYQTTSHEQINDTVEITMHRHHKRTSLQPDDTSIAHAHSTDTITMEKKRFHQKKQKQIHQIQKSLKTLKMISSQSILSDGSSLDNDVVDIFGRQLNKLWKRLTGEYEEKFEPEQIYRLSKPDLEQLYEQAKTVVLQQFCTNEEEFKRRLIDNSIAGDSENGSNLMSQPATEIIDSAKSEQEHEPIVPTLNLTSSSEAREIIVSDTDPGYYFSNSLNENKIEQNGEQQQEQVRSGSDTVVEALASDATTQNIDDSQIKTEEQIEEDDEIQSDITEDSLNKPLQFANGNVDSSEIQTIPETESHVNESDDRSSQIPSAIENEQLSEVQTQDMNENSTQLIEETSFPEMDIPSVNASSVAEEISAAKLSSSVEQNYTSDNFEDKNASTNEVTTNSTASTTKAPTSTPRTATASSTTATNQITENISEKSVEQPSEDGLPKELEQRLILIDDGLRDLREAISQSPVLQSEPEISEQSNQIDDSKQETNSASPTSDSEKQSTQNDKSEMTEDLEASENQSETENATESSNATTKIETSAENEVSSKMGSDESTDSIAAEIATSNTDNSALTDTTAAKRPFQYTLSGGSIDYNKVPEADALKRAPLPVETEV